MSGYFKEIERMSGQKTETRSQKKRKMDGKKTKISFEIVMSLIFGLLVTMSLIKISVKFQLCI